MYWTPKFCFSKWFELDEWVDSQGQRFLVTTSNNCSRSEFSEQSAKAGLMFLTFWRSIWDHLFCTKIWILFQQQHVLAWRNQARQCQGQLGLSE